MATEVHAPLATLDPHLLGPLGGKPAVQTRQMDLFVGEEEYLSDKQRRQRRELRERITQLAERVLGRDEQILYLAPGMQIPPLFHQLGIGALVYNYHRVALIFTTQRLLEILLSYNGKRAETRIRSFLWNQVKDVKMALNGLVVKPKAGRTHKWRLQIRGDKKLLKLLVPKIRERLVSRQPVAPQAVPLWHCPVCGFATPSHPQSCTSCGTVFRSSRMAALLAIALPGGGLFYTGHPLLGAFDLIGELALFAVFAAFLGGATGQADLIAAFGLGAFLFFLTKIESIHVSHVLVKRTKPETPEQRRFWHRVAVGGGVVSLAAILGAVGFAGRFASVMHHDLQFAAEDLGWTGNRVRSQWQLFADDSHTRSEWVHTEGAVLGVMAFPLGPQESFADFRRDYNEILAQKGQPPTEPVRIGSLEGLRSIRRLALPDGTPITGIRYLIYDRKGKDVHMVLGNVRPAEAAAAEEKLRALLTRAQWIPAETPKP